MRNECNRRESLKSGHGLMSCIASEVRVKKAFWLVVVNDDRKDEMTMATCAHLNFLVAICPSSPSGKCYKLRIQGQQHLSKVKQAADWRRCLK